MINSPENLPYSKLSEKYQNILNSILNFYEKENPQNDLSYKWYLNLKKFKVFKKDSKRQKY